jgi:hypothetical protein
MAGDGPDVTLASTDKALYTPSMFPVLGGQYFDIGRKLMIRLFGKITTAATPGNGVFDVYYGDGTDANGVLLVSSLSTTALSASQTTKSWWATFYVSCRTSGSVGTLFVDGLAFFSNLVVATTAQPVIIPPDTAVVSGACDLTASKIISVQFKRSGSTAEHMWVQDMEVVSLNG